MFFSASRPLVAKPLMGPTWHFLNAVARRFKPGSGVTYNQRLTHHSPLSLEQTVLSLRDTLTSQVLGPSQTQ